MIAASASARGSRLCTPARVNAATRRARPAHTQAPDGRRNKYLIPAAARSFSFAPPPGIAMGNGLTSGYLASTASSRSALPPPPASSGMATDSAPAPSPDAEMEKAATPRLVTYNVLSSNLSPPDYFPYCKPEDLNPKARYVRVLEKLEREVAGGAIIALQEVSMTWAGDLHAWFAERGYHFVLHLYGRPFNGYMGVGLAFPVDRYDAMDVNIVRLSDTKRWPRGPKPGPVKKLLGKVAGPVVGVWRKMRGTKPPTDPWSYSRSRFNSLVQARLRCKSSGVAFAVATYHMPCAFWAPQVMTIHTGLMVQCAQRFAKGMPLVILGDMNVKPGDGPYKLITEGSLDEDAPDFPTPPEWDNWSPTPGQSMRSAYAVAGKEPDFTNFARVKNRDVFIDTLDYIFISPGVVVKDVLPLPHRDDVTGPFPTESEPSDHLMIAATLEVPAPPPPTAEAPKAPPRIK